jgi:uncharacterized protein (TIGR00255 family)
MVRSMTGFGRAEGEFQGVRVVAEIRTVNHRGLDISLRLPRFLNSMELAARRLIQGSLSRGKISASVSWDGDSDGAGDVRVNTEAAARYIGMLRALKDEFDLPGEIDVHVIAARPEVFTWERAGVSENEAWDMVEPLVLHALADLDSMRATEGRALAEDLHGRIAVMDTHLAAIEARAPLRVTSVRAQLHSRIQALLDELPVDEHRIAMEVALHADRLDVTEECVRLRAHHRQFLELLDGPESAGRKLNFLLQEMNREVNTIGSKANDVEIVNHVLALKEEIEKMREQVQNVE